jgi:hypothetical protein
MVLTDIIPLPENITLMITGQNVLGNMFMINQSSNSDTISIAINTNPNILPTSKCWILYNANVPPNHTLTLQDIGISASQGIYVYSYNGTTSFTLTGNSY